MVNPEEVSPEKFQDHVVLYDSENFSVAWGTWEDGTRTLGMRWNGEPDSDDVGYPKLFNNPVWMVIDHRLSVPFLTALLDKEYSRNEKILNVLIELKEKDQL